MSEECPYCSAEIAILEVARMRRTRLSFPEIFGHSRATTSTAPSLDVNCGACDRKFTLAKFRDLTWIVSEVKYETNTIRRFFAYEIDQRALSSNITGITFRDRKKKMDICFRHLGQRAYISCVKEQDGWHAVTVEMIRFG